jgi:hypothetical protein
VIDEKYPLLQEALPFPNPLECLVIKGRFLHGNAPFEHDMAMFVAGTPFLERTTQHSEAGR